MASKSRIQGITIEFGGDTTKLTKALKEVDSQLKTTTEKLKDVNKLLKLDPGNAELLTQKQKALADAIKQTSDRLTQLKNAQSQVKEGTQEWDALQREIIETENNLESLEKEYEDFGSVAAQQIKAVGEKMQEIGSKLTSVGKTLTTKVTLPIVAGFTAAAKSASDYEENLNKLQVAFGRSAKEVQNFTDNAMAAYGLSKVAASEAASSFGALAKGVGLADSQAASMAITLTGLTSDLASYFNTQNDVAATALEAIFTGQTQALKKFGVVMTETNLEKFASDHKKVYKAMSQTEKVMLRYQYVLESTKDAQGDYSRTSDGTANSVKTFAAAIQDLGTAIGSVLLPIITPVINKLTEIINKIANLPEPVQKVIVVLGLIVAAIGPLLVTGGKLVTGAGTLLVLAPKIIAAIGGVGTAFGAAGTSVGAACAGMIASVGGFIVLAVAAIAAGVLLAKTISEHWDDIVAATKRAWESVSFYLKSAWIAIRDTWNDIWRTITTRVSQVTNAITSGFTYAKNAALNSLSALLNGAKNIMTNLWDAIRNAIHSIGNMFSNAHWSLPDIKLPHFSIHWKDIGGIIKLPLVHVEWYKKAYENPYLFTDPTIMGGRGFGDGGGSGELVYGRDQLLRDIAQASGGETTINIYASDGMDVNQLANKVQLRLAQLQRQRLNAYA